jgi:hypothetical protein
MLWSAVPASPLTLKFHVPATFAGAPAATVKLTTLASSASVIRILKTFIVPAPLCNLRG